MKTFTRCGDGIESVTARTVGISLTARAGARSFAQLDFASCTRAALLPLLRRSLYCVSRGASTPATASSMALRTHACPSFFPHVAALSQSVSAA